VLSAAATLGVTLTRLAADLQTWAGAGYGFLSWPDDLVSTSSIMPQKRNPYVLEQIRGRAAEPAGALVATLLGLKSAAFSNSVEVSGEAARHVFPALAATATAVRLTTLMVDGLEVHGERMRAFMDDRQLAMTEVANHLVTRCGLPFRAAHDAVGQLARELGSRDPTAAEAAERLAAILAAGGWKGAPPEEAGLRQALDLEAAARRASHGGGPDPAVVERQLLDLARRRQAIAERAGGWRRGLAQAQQRLQTDVEARAGGAGGGEA
jgi:argininosuccinate lyase